MAAIDDLVAALTQLDTDVKALIATQSPPVDLSGAQAQVAAIDAEVKAATPAASGASGIVTLAIGPHIGYSACMLDRSMRGL